MKTNPFGLMAINRSVAEVRERPVPFRLDSRGMPRFGARGPDASRAAATPAATGPSLANGVFQERPVGGSHPLGRIGAVGTRPEAAGSAAAWSGAARSDRSGLLSFAWRWFGGRRSRARTLVQGELSLETVQVVRNDLRDADYAVARPARAVAVRLRQSQSVDTPPVLAVGAWRRWVGALFRMGS